MVQSLGLRHLGNTAHAEMMLSAVYWGGEVVPYHSSTDHLLPLPFC